MKVILINPPYLKIYGETKEAAGCYFPLGLGYLASYLMKNNNTDVRLLDMNATRLDYKEVAEIIKKENPAIIGITCVTPNFSEAVSIAKMCKEICNAKIILGGAHASALQENILDKYEQFDIAVIGEGEITLSEICSNINNIDEEISNIKGIIYRRDKKVLKTPARQFELNIDKFPFPARHLADQNLYRPQSYLDIGEKSSTIITSRGCPYKCTFCAGHLTCGNVFRAHSAEYVISEITELTTKYGVRYLIIHDDTFTFDKKRTAKICEMIIDINLGVKWFCLTRVNDVNAELLKLMKKAGCIGLHYGIESGDSEILRSYKKGITLDMASSILNETNKLGIRSHISFIIGNKNETKDSIEKTISFAKELKPTFAFFNILTPYPGTEVYQNLFLADTLFNWDKFIASSDSVIIKPDNLDKEYIRKSISKAYRNFYLRPVQTWNIISKIRNFREFLINMKILYAFIKTIVK